MLTIIEKVILLQNIDIFALIPSEQLAYLAVITKEVSFKKGDIIYRRNDSPDTLYLVLEGEVSLHIDDREISSSRDNEAFGTWALFDEEPRMTTATAARDTKLLSIEREDFMDLLADHIQITQGILKTMVRRLRSLADRIGFDTSRYKSKSSEG